jgi:hypothetical protein
MLLVKIHWSLSHGISCFFFPLKPVYLSTFFIFIGFFWKTCIMTDIFKQEGNYNANQLK